jgi:Outer membrane protein beta-barrel domain
MICRVSRPLPRLVIVVGVLALTSLPAAAQSEGRFAIGAQVSFHFPTSEELENSASLGVAYRLTRASTHDGWGPDFGFGWYGADLAAPLDGRINVRPLLGGVAYRIVRGKIRTHFAALTGPAFVKVQVNDQERAAYSALLGIPVVGVDGKNTWAFKPGVRVTYDLKPRLGVFVSTDYEIARPKLEIKTATTSVERKLKGDVFNVKVGFLVGVLK